MSKEQFEEYAFPLSDEQVMTGNAGMTLLDYFAGQALSRVIGATRAIGSPGWQEEAAWSAYSIARAMLEERKKK